MLKRLRTRWRRWGLPPSPLAASAATIRSERSRAAASAANLARRGGGRSPREGTPLAAAHSPAMASAEAPPEPARSAPFGARVPPRGMWPDEAPKAPHSGRGGVALASASASALES
eukprot:696425-Prorocentrum_minimum.AAC.1